jgi:hypothetical protein
MVPGYVGAWGRQIKSVLDVVHGVCFWSTLCHTTPWDPGHWTPLRSVTFIKPGPQFRHPPAACNMQCGDFGPLGYRLVPCEPFKPEHRGNVGGQVARSAEVRFVLRPRVHPKDFPPFPRRRRPEH